MKKQSQIRKAGFSLVEVCLAVLVVGLGLLSIFSLFPTGLAASEAATGDTEMGLFAEQALFGFQARATEVTWDEWKNKDFDIPDVTIGAVAKNSKGNVAYLLTMTTGTVSTIYKATLTAMPWKAPQLPPQALLTTVGTQFYTEAYYMELP